MAFKLNNENIPDFVRVVKINQSLLPEIADNTIEVNGRAGNVDNKSKIGSRKIQIEYLIVAAGEADLRNKLRQLGQFIYFDTVRDLEILDEPGKIYKAKITGNSDIDEYLKVGKGVMEFIAPDPFLYDTEIKSYQFDPEFTGNTFLVEGAGDVGPVIDLTVNQHLTALSIISGDKFLKFGAPRIIDNTTYDPEPVIFHDTMGSPNNWLNGISLTDGGVMAGQFVSNGYSTRVDDYGQEAGSSWYGPAAVKSLGGQFQDFKASIDCGIHAGSIGELGRIHISFFDVNNTHVATISIRNGNPDEITPYAEAWVGQKRVAYGYGYFPGVWRDWSAGNMAIARRGNKWSFYWAMYNATGQHVARTLDSFVDTANNHLNKVSKIQVHIARHVYLDSEPISNIHISDIKVYNLSPAPPPTNNPINETIIQNGDRIVIDNERGIITKNGQPFYDYLYPQSDFIKFKKGLNTVEMRHSGNGSISAGGTISYKERWV